MSYNLIETLIEAQARDYGEAQAPDAVRRRIRVRRARNATLSGAGAFVAISAVAAGGVHVAGWGRGFTPEAWAPAPRPFSADVSGDGQARVPLPTPPQPKLSAFLTADNQCPPFAPPPTTRQGHATVSLQRVVFGNDTEYKAQPGDDFWASAGHLTRVVEYTIASTTGAPTSIRISEARLYFVQDGLVTEVATTWQTDLPTSIEVRIDDETFEATAGRTVHHLGGERPVQAQTGVVLGGWPCGRSLQIDSQMFGLSAGEEYQVYLEVRVVADEQSAAQLHLQDEGVDLDTVTGNNGTIVDIVTNNGITQRYEAIDVSFPASYLQDQFDEVIVSDPITIRVPEGWGTLE